MEILKYLSDPKGESAEKASSIVAEYRLLSSGTIYRQVTGDWTKSETARYLLDPPLTLFATSEPQTNYPSELALRLLVPLRRESDSDNKVTFMFYPDEEVADDIAAALTLLNRRLVTVSGKANQQTLDGRKCCDFDYRPVELVTAMRRIHWPRHPDGVITWPGGEREIINYNPLPKSIDSAELTSLLLGLPRIKYAESLVKSVRLYSSAMEQIHDRPQASYQLLISAVEAIAGDVLKSFEPTDEDKVQHKRSVYKRALDLMLDEQTARMLAIEACKGEHWIGRKFKKFLVDSIDDSIWNSEDPLYRSLSAHHLPKREQFERTLSSIYSARSTATHTGERFPATATFAGSPRMPARTMVSLWSANPPFPPVVWFERIVNNAIRNFWMRSVRELATEENQSAPTASDS